MSVGVNVDTQSCIHYEFIAIVTMIFILLIVFVSNAHLNRDKLQCNSGLILQWDSGDTGELDRHAQHKKNADLQAERLVLLSDKNNLVY